MPRAHRHFLAGHVWHITHRCHKQQFLLKFSRDRKQWLHWLYEARKRYGLCILNYVVTSNHIHLLVKDQGRDEIARSMQLIGGRTAQQYNNRKSRKGAYWEDRYHATAVQTDDHLARCLVYIDLNMVRAGVVDHPAAWAHGGYNEIQTPPQRYRLIDVDQLTQVLGFGDAYRMRETHRQWVQATLESGKTEREPWWSESMAVGQPEFLESMLKKLRPGHTGGHIVEVEGCFQLREEPATYTCNFMPENGNLSLDKTPFQSNSINSLVS